MSDRRIIEFVTALIVLAAIGAPTALGQGQTTSGDTLVDHDETWDADQWVNGTVTIAENATLTIQGANISLGGLFIEPGGRLSMRSTQNASAQLWSTRGDGWTGQVLGSFDIRGTPEKPVVIDGIGGKAAVTGAAAYFSRGLYVVGTLDGENVIFQNYTAGMDVTSGGRATLTDVRLSSPGGVGIILANGELVIDRAALSGEGGRVYIGKEGHAKLSGATFDGTDDAIVVHGRTAELRDISITRGDTCVRVHLGAVRISNLSCEGFSAAALAIYPGEAGEQPSVDVDGLIARTTESNATAVVNSIAPIRVAVRNSSIGPAPVDGLRLLGRLPDLEGTRFQGVQGYNVVIISPDEDVPERPVGQGAPGGKGWLQVVDAISVNVTDSHGYPAPNTLVAIVRQSNDTVAARIDAEDGGITRSVYLERMQIDGNGTVTRHAYAVVGRNSALAEVGEILDVEPTGDVVAMKLVPEHADTPGATPLALVVAVGCAAFIVRRTR